MSSKKTFLPIRLHLLFAFFAVGFVGCNSSAAPEFVLHEEPDRLLGVVEVREALLGPNEASHAEHLHDEGEHAEAEDHGHDVDENADHEGHDDDEYAHDDVHDPGDGHSEGYDEVEGHDEDPHADDDHAEHDHEKLATEQGQEKHEHQHMSTENAGPAGPIDVAVVGQIGGLPNPWEKTEPNYPFVQGQAKFFLADAAEVAQHLAEGHHHAPGEECAFCAAHAGDSTSLLAVVQFNDKNGKIVRRDARQLFDLKGSETVVVRGKARIVDGGLLVVDADGMYIRR